MSRETDKNELVRFDDIKSRIFTIRGVQVILDRDIAYLFGVETKVLNQAVKRNIERFLDEFYFALSNQELAILRSQFVTSSWGGTRKNPHVFTETGVAMLSSVYHIGASLKDLGKKWFAFSRMEIKAAEMLTKIRNIRGL